MATITKKPRGDAEGIEARDSAVEALIKQMNREEATFVTRVANLMELKGTNQTQLAKLIGVRQSAISMMLCRDCRPQRRTVEKMATVLGVSPEDLWPGMKPE